MVSISGTYWEKEITNLFITAPVTAMQGSIEDKASARRHDLTKAMANAAKNAAVALTTRATFSDIAC